MDSDNYEILIRILHSFFDRSINIIMDSDNYEILIRILYLSYISPCQRGLEYADCIFCKGVSSPP